MGHAFRLGRIRGIDITIDWSWLFVFGLMTWNLTEIFTRWHPQWARGPAFFLAVVASLLFFGSVLVHELAHAVVAIRYGMKVRQIRLFLFGGVSDIEREPPSPRAELRMAIAGPLTSIGLGLLLTAIVTTALPQSVLLERDPIAAFANCTPLETLALWLGPINVSVGLFNLLPAFPLDGGRILRALVWKATNDLHRATRIATSCGRFFGFTLMAAGAAMTFGLHVPFFGTGIGGLWLVFLGWFLRGAAKQSFGALVMEEMLDGLRVEDLMRRTGPALDPHVTLRAAIDDGFVRSHDHAFPILAEGRLVGLLTVADVNRVPAASWATTPVTSAMTPLGKLDTVEPSLPAFAALKRLAERDVEQLPVLDGDRLVGVLSRSDITRWLELRVSARRPLVPHAA